MLVDLVKVVLQVGDHGVWDGLAALIEAGLENVVCDVRLGLAAYVHDVQA